MGELCRTGRFGVLIVELAAVVSGCAREGPTPGGERQRVRFGLAIQAPELDGFVKICDVESGSVADGFRGASA